MRHKLSRLIDNTNTMRMKEDFRKDQFVERKYITTRKNEVPFSTWLLFNPANLCLICFSSVFLVGSFVLQ